MVITKKIQIPKEWHAHPLESGCSGILNTWDDLKSVLENPEYKNIYFVTGCSGPKTSASKKGAIPKYFYASDRIKRFIQYCERFNLNYAILSGLTRSIFWSDEIIQHYDFNPPFYTEEQYKEIAALTQKKCKERGVDCLILYHPGPLMARRIFKWLEHSGIHWYYTTKLITIFSKSKTLI
jgi:hypothetical protein